MHFGDREARLRRDGLDAARHGARGLRRWRIAFQMRREARVAMTWFGDGSTANGQWHEAMNVAGVRKLPVVFVLENNQFAYSTPNDARVRGRPRRARRRLRLRGVKVDGNDVEAVFEAAAEATERARLRWRPDAHPGRDDAHARPRRARRHALRAEGDARGVGAARPDRALRGAAARGGSRRGGRSENR